MTVAKSILKCLVVVSAMVGLLLAAGCGGSGEKEKMTAFLDNYQKTLEEYSNADSGQKAEIEAKLDGMKEQWTLLKDQIATNITPQAMEKFVARFQELSEKYASMKGSS